MAASAEYLDFIKEQLSDFGPVSVRRMFGGAGVYQDGLMFALIADETLYLKVDEENRARFEAAGLPPFVYVTKDGDRMSMSYFQAPPDALESPAVMVEWARLGYAAALRAKTRKPARKRKG